MKKKSTKIWVVLLAAPIPLLIFTAILQILARFMFGATTESTANGIETLINIISLLIGVFSAIALIGMPIWIIMLVLTLQHNSKIAQTTTKITQN